MMGFHEHTYVYTACFIKFYSGLYGGYIQHCSGSQMILGDLNLCSQTFVSSS